MTTETLVTENKEEPVQSPKTTSSKFVDMSVEKMVKVEVCRVGKGAGLDAFPWMRFPDQFTRNGQM